MEWLRRECDREVKEHTKGFPYHQTIAEIFDCVNGVCDGQTIDPVDQACGDGFFGRHGKGSREEDMALSRAIELGKLKWLSHGDGTSDQPHGFEFQMMRSVDSGLGMGTNHLGRSG